VNNFRDQQERVTSSRIGQGTKLINISAELLNLKSNYQNIQRYTELELEIAGDADATLPYLIEACKQLITSSRRRELDERGKRLSAVHAQALEQARISATYEWDLSPVSRGRLHAEMWDVMRDKDWVSLGGTSRLWNIEKHYQTMGGGGAAALGSGLPIAIGAALGHKPDGRLCVRIQPDGDFMYVPGALWTAAHHRIPFLTVMWNNRAYHQEVMHITRLALRHQRGGTDLDKTSGIGTKLHNPNIDYSSIARGMGVFAEGPITNPQDLGPALRRAVDVVMKGEPALVDVVTQPR
jgi:acetolactate synthase-1/2/3 large subunit